MRPLRPVLLATVALLLVGCSISESVKSSFESSSASVASSSGSSESSGSKDRESYRNEVRDYTSAYVKSGGQFENFTRGLDSIAARHDVTNWEDDQDTYVGIGAGLRVGGVTAEQFTVWQTNLAGGDSAKASSMQKGWDQAK
ncbi:putative lipoprotein [bacterium]|nr:putative lipoprotein [bacterium]